MWRARRLRRWERRPAALGRRRLEPIGAALFRRRDTQLLGGPLLSGLQDSGIGGTPRDDGMMGQRWTAGWRHRGVVGSGMVKGRWNDGNLEQFENETEGWWLRHCARSLLRSQ